ncbi:hypothetical protein MEY_05225 [Candida albicans 19F]|nr:hypothetical protein MEY_05225 [Candida albicans 19F]
MTKPTKDNNDDVLDFINSLPDSKPGTPKPSKTSGSNTGGGNDSTENKEDLLDFLDELEQHEKTKKTKKPSKLAPKTASKPTSSDADDEPTTGTTTDKSDTTNEDIEPQQPQEKTNEESDNQDIPNPISSITSWWNSEGSNKVNSLWGKITDNAEKLSEQTYQLANDATNQLNTRARNLDTDQITGQLNNLFHNVSNTLKQGLIEEADEILNVSIINEINYDAINVNILVLDNFLKVVNQVEGRIHVRLNEFNQGQEEQIKKNQEDQVEHHQEQSNIVITCNANQDEENKLVYFEITLKDITNGITITNKSQSLPLQWWKWIQGEKLEFDESIDPKEWVKTWVKNGLDLSVGISVQQYIINRMGV